MDTSRLVQDRIVLVGRRKGAIVAARRCGYEPVVIDVKSRIEQSRLAFGGAADWALERVREMFPEGHGRPPIGVAAVTTGSVVAAAAIRQYFRLPGIAPEVAMRCHDKLVMKKAIAAAGLPCAPWVEAGEQTSAAELIDLLGLPVVLKMPISSGGRGVWICHDQDELASRLKPGLLVEGFVRGTELSVETYRANDVTIFRNLTNYLKPRWANIVPNDLPGEDARQVDSLAEKVHHALGLGDGISHMEVFLGGDGPVFGEIAARPPGGYIMDLMARAYDFDPWEALLRLAVAETPRMPRSHKRFAGMWLLHPEPGVVSRVNGLDEALAIPGVVHASCKLCAGDVVGERIGSGDSKGYVLAEAATLPACAEALEQAVGTVRVSYQA
ncbi:MAG: ATP-grasp domain-containing protein [Akkermansiaceae bacterium]|nr:ATP-grasp domain-containing protein [Akkermansiaceae bacterium]